MEESYDSELVEKKMHNPNLGLYVGIGLLLLFLVPLLILSVDRSKRVETEGTIVAFDDEGHPIVEYEVDGKTYTFEPKNPFSRRKDDREGSTMTLLYQKDAPENAKAVYLYYSAVVVFAVPGFAVIVVWAILRFLRKRKEAHKEEDPRPREEQTEKPREEQTEKPIDESRAERDFRRFFKVFTYYFICGGLLFFIAGLITLIKGDAIGSIAFIGDGIVFTAVGLFLRKGFLSIFMNRK